MKSRFKYWLALAALSMSVNTARPTPAMAEYYSFDVPSGANIITQEVRWPVWAESTYNAIWTNDLVSADKSRVYFYGGVPEADPEKPDDHPANIIWSFWPVSHPVNPGETVRVAWGNPQMYAPLAVGEGASGKASGAWPQLKTKQWYQFVMRVWQPIDNPAGHAFAGQWMRDPADDHWYHIATMEVPFKATGTSGASGFIEDFSHGNRNPRRTEFRNVYYHSPSSDWKAAKNLTPSVRQHGEKGTVDLIENGTASFFETCSGPEYKGNLDYDAGIPKRTVTMDQPDSPNLPAPAVASVTAERGGKQILVSWDVAPAASPQFAWKIEGFDSEGHSATFTEARDPEARQGFIDSSKTGIAKIRLILTDIFDQTVSSEIIVPKPVQCDPAVKVTAVKPGLGFAYYESASESSTDWNHLPNFSELRPVLSGDTNGIDMTVRRRRTKYAIDYSGFLNVPTEGIYAFRLSSYDGSRLIIDRSTVIDNDGVHSYTDKRGTAALAAGLHPIELQYFRDTDRGEHCTYADRMNLDWEGPNLPLQPVPVKAYFCKEKTGGLIASIIVPHNPAGIPNSPVRFDVNLRTGVQTVKRVAYYVDDILWASRESEPWNDSVTLPKGSFDVHARIFTGTGEAFDTLPVHLETRQVTTGPWKVVQIGTPPPRRPLGAAVHGSDSVYLVGDGNGIACQEISGNVSITAHIAERPASGHGTQDDGTVADGGWIGGILFRTDLTAHDTFLGDKFVASYACVDGTTHLQCQLDHNGGGPVAGPDLGHFDWIKLDRHGNTFTTSYSKDGIAWQPNGSRTVDLPVKLFAGVFIYSTPGYNQHINAWLFDHINIKPAGY
jgi:hypothetical protein